jgi:aryl-alcohol dehydrogenase-like predicted oxidoreductase
VKLGLGTVQFGLDYGISNQAGRTPPEEVRKILEVAAENGIRVLDTAALYGTSEEVLGQSLPPDHAFDIVTKTPVFSDGCLSSDDARRLEETFQQSLSKMRQPGVYGLLMHNADNLLAKNGELLMGKMLDLKQRGLVKKVGASVYAGEQIDRLLQSYQLDLVQLPVNVLDQRLLAGGQLARLKRAGVEIHARSAFLQGLLLMEPDSLPTYFESAKAHLKSYRAYLREHGISPLQAALGFVVGLKEVDVVLCGINNHQQLEELIALAQPLPGFDRLMDFAIDDPAILNPSRWQKCS